jgi:hypothetical protein
MCFVWGLWETGILGNFLEPIGGDFYDEIFDEIF